MELAEHTKGPRPLKRTCTPDDDVVSLDSSGDELDEELVALASGPSKSRYAALKIILSKMLTKARSVLKQVHSLALDLNSKSDLFAAPLSDTKINSPAEWLLDSGASMHFTNDINDFVDYQTTTPIKVVTANGPTQVKGKGAVILVINQKAVRIEPVYHIPDLTTKLISLGQLLQSRLYTRGSACSLSVEDGSEIFLTFYPSEMNLNLYFVWALIYKEEALANTVQCIYAVDFEVMHRRLAHPSKEVLQKAQKHVKEFPKISFPEGAHVCP